jgi:hypothetical protein
MATTGTRADRSEPAALAGHLRGAECVRIVSRADGDGLAAAAIFGDALATLGVPRHLSMARAREAAAPRFEAAGTALAPGFADLGPACPRDSAALWAFETARELGADPDPGLALAGAIAAGAPLQGAALKAVSQDGLERRPGVASPTTDVAEGLAYSGLLHAPFSGDEDAAAAFLDELDRPTGQTDDSRTDLASAVALAATEDRISNRAVSQLHGALAPHPSPTDFATIEGYGDVLRAAARVEPGAALAATLGTVDAELLLDKWRSYGSDLHRAIEDLPADEDRVTAMVEAVSPRDVIRLGHAYRGPAAELAVAGPDSLALATTEREAVSVLEDRFTDARVTGSESMATVWTEADPQSVFEVEAER